MQIGEIIRKYRKEKNMTQEEMARRLGVTAPAVNKWEKGVSLPDILLLAPIARILEITPETLLSFHSELTEEEINRIVEEIDEKFEKESYDSVFSYAKKVIQQYPNSAKLMWQLAVILYARKLTEDFPEKDSYDAQILEWYQRALLQGDEKIKRSAAGSLFAYYLQKEDYTKAEEYLSYYSDEGMEKKRSLADLYRLSNRTEEAYKAYEEILFSSYAMSSAILHCLCMLAMQEGDSVMAHKFVEKESALAKLFEMGTYREESCKLETASWEKNKEETLRVVSRMLSSVESLYGFSESSLYSHMKFKPLSEKFYANLYKDLIKLFQDKEAFSYMKGNEEWEEMIKSGYERFGKQSGNEAI